MGSLTQPKELETYCRPSTKQPSFKFWIGELGCDVQRFQQRLFSRLIGSGGCVRLRERSKEKHSVCTSIRPKVSEPAMSCFDRFLEAAIREESTGQLGKASPDHPAIIEFDIYFERFTEIC